MIYVCITGEVIRGGMIFLVFSKKGKSVVDFCISYG